MAVSGQRNKGVNARQLELNPQVGDGAAHHPHNVNIKVEDARAQAAFYEQRHAQWENQRRELESVNERKAIFSSHLDEVGLKIHNATRRIASEQESIQRELREIDEVQACLTRHLQILSSLDPRDWSPEGLSDRMREAVPRLQRAENDLEEAFYHGRHLRHSRVFDAVSWEGAKQGLTWHKLAEQLLKGLFFHLPLFILLLLSWGVYAYFH